MEFVECNVSINDILVAAESMDDFWIKFNKTISQFQRSYEKYLRKDNNINNTVLTGSNFEELISLMKSKLNSIQICMIKYLIYV